MLMTVDAEEIASETQCFALPEDRESEAKLSTEIVKLWSAHQNGKAIPAANSIILRLA
jgi:hypothetical protein